MEGQDLADRGSRGKPEVTGEVADAGPDLRVAAIAVQDRDGASGGHQKAEQASHEGGLACAVCPQQDMDLPGADLQRHPDHGSDLAEVLREVVEAGVGWAHLVRLGRHPGVPVPLLTKLTV